MTVRLLKVVVRPVFVVDDGEHLTEVQGPTAEVPASAWREFGTTAFDQDGVDEMAEHLGLTVDPD